MSLSQGNTGNTRESTIAWVWLVCHDRLCLLSSDLETPAHIAHLHTCTPAHLHT